MSRTRARGDARGHRDHPSLGATRLGEGVEVGGLGRLQRRHPILGTGGQISQAIKNDEGHFGPGLDLKFRVNGIEFAHKSRRRKDSGAPRCRRSPQTPMQTLLAGQYPVNFALATVAWDPGGGSSEVVDTLR
jgi:hypothetical protein